MNLAPEVMLVSYFMIGVCFDIISQLASPKKVESVWTRLVELIVCSTLWPLILIAATVLAVMKLSKDCESE